LSPNGGENLAATKIYNITWKTLEGAELPYVAIEYSPDNGRSWQDIAICQNTGSRQWEIPLIDSNQCLVRISDPNNADVFDTSDRVFTIFQCRGNFASDLNGDCYVDFLDFVIMAGDWLKCANPFDPSCDVQQ
jgi:hypothetical protein